MSIVMNDIFYDRKVFRRGYNCASL